MKGNNKRVMIKSPPWEIKSFTVGMYSMATLTVILVHNIRKRLRMLFRIQK